ncbi:DUF4234 domain-containing protein [Pseudoalteromonas denitrificans]|jgi:hypothetical protein|uniref:DUF4234 domain-containing protein n=1 Tax=Pseudoalteromonas denitrificans DSM 6059 TaxID=1123010 RepID=A0A1I1TEV3_9GAMM|nr:DUF4234 domain-containing protein [Pseudoalteromonas denitrificans]SFD57112.1 protein of unknown function [Pseudoalteromonas denitrificans DSM 6059]
MSNINELKDQINTKTMNFVLLTIATAGIYPILWLYNNYQIIDKVSGIRTADNNYIIWIAVCIGLGGAFSGTGDQVMDSIGGLLTIAASVLYIIWAFKAKKALQEYVLNTYKIDLKMNGIYTFFFNVYYINYCINDLSEVQRKNDVLTGQTSPQES